MNELRPPAHGTDGTTVAPVVSRAPDDDIEPHHHAVPSRQVVLDLVRSSPPDGRLRTGGRDLPFTGWLELLAAIETALADPP